MQVIISIIGMILFIVEWYFIRKTAINKWIPLGVAFVIALPIGLFIGAHLVAFPLMMLFLAVVFCWVEDWLKQYGQRKSLTELQLSKMKDL